MGVMGSLLAYLILGGIMGMLGQGARAVIGLRGTSDSAKAVSVSPTDLIQAGRLIASCLTGFLVGLAAALVSLKSGDMSSLLSNLPSWQTLMAWFAAGYAGTDFLEGFVAAYAPQGAQAAAARQPAPLNAKSIVYAALAEQVTKSFDDNSILAKSPISWDNTDPTNYLALLNAINRRIVRADPGIPDSKLPSLPEAHAWQDPATTVGAIVKSVASKLA